MPNLDNCDVTPDIVKKYYDAMRCANEYFDDPMKEFIKEYPLAYKRLNSVHCKRVKINSNIEALRTLGLPLQFGTLTYDESKDHNKIESKRKEAFAYLNSIFKYVLLIEEYGENKGRYHVHFVGVYRENKTFEDFINGWHSRQNIETLHDDKKVGAYLCKYLAKQTPRLRRNKALVSLERAFHKHKRLKRSFPTLFEEVMKQNITSITIFDL